jgi:hypothetical protein
MNSKIRRSTVYVTNISDTISSIRHKGLGTNGPKKMTHRTDLTVIILRS